MSGKKKKAQWADANNLTENGISESLNKEGRSKIVSSEKNQNAEFIKELESAVKDLWFMSETDAEIKVYTGKATDSVSKESLTKQISGFSETDIEEKSFADFFRNLTKIQGWYGEEEKATANKFSVLEKLLEKNLKDLRVFKIGQTEIDIYVVGLDSQSILTGITTKAIET